MGFLARVLAMTIKEARQLRRDRLTFAMMLGIPIMQLMLFGFAINSDPRDLPAAIVAADQSTVTRAIAAAIANTGYVRFVREPASEAEATRLMERGEVQFVVTIPADFTRRLVRGERAQIVVDADATDPLSASGALGAIPPAVQTALARELVGPLAARAAALRDVEVVLQRRYNPEGLTRYNIVPGLLAIILTMTLVMMTALAVTREHERGTMETLLSMPVRPIEVMIGKIAPYVLVGSIQVAVILVAARLVFEVPMVGSLALLAAATVLFITVNLAIGFTFSTVARNQLQAVQMSFFFLMPSILLSGFMFPFRGMPGWAQTLGEALPATHFLRIVRTVLLKGGEAASVTHEIGALALTLAIVTTVAISRYRVTLD
ncbi:MAG: ABC transporter permease [Alphaproteobacteria bacterium]|nr:ABC transporter permease [Alphaproteobacteria bacterium]